MPKKLDVNDLENITGGASTSTPVFKKDIIVLHNDQDNKLSNYPKIKKPGDNDHANGVKPR